jgi:hypothetical protein
MKPFFPRLNHGRKLGDLLPAAPSIPVFLIGLVLMAVSLSALLVPRGTNGAPRVGGRQYASRAQSA